MPSWAPNETEVTEQVQSPAAAGTLTPDLNQGHIIFVNMPAGNITIANPLNPGWAGIVTFFIKQDGVGSRTVTWGSQYKRAGGALTLTTTANATDSVTFRYDASTGFWNEVGRALALA